MVNSTQQASSNLLAALLHLGRRARQSEDEAQLDFILVNETFQLTPYRQAALWLEDDGISALSGVVTPEANAPYVQWLSRLCRFLGDSSLSSPKVVRPTDLPEQLGAEWAEWLPAHVVGVPIPAIGQRFSGGLLILARDKNWSDSELGLLAEWASIWAGTRALIDRGGAFSRLWQRLHGRPARIARTSDKSWLAAWVRQPRTWILVLCLALLFLPVRLTVLAPAELVPLAPTLVRAPIDGVIEHVHILPNETVDVGTSLFEFDRTTIRNRLLIAERSVDTVRAELRQRAQQALFDEASKSQVAILQGQLAEKQLEAEYLQELAERSLVRAQRPGVVLFDDPTEWVGRPVITGERVMVIADEQEVELEAWLAPANAIALAAGSRVRVYLNADPTRPIEAELRYVGHEAILRPDGQYAYRVRASILQTNDRTRIGLKGTAKLEGDQVPLVYWIMRRPLAALRATVGI